MSSKGWADLMALHLIPEGDDVDHVPAYSCPCGPRRDTIPHEGSLRWAVVHRSIDEVEQDQGEA